MNTLTLQIALTGVIFVLCFHDLYFRPQLYSKFFWIAMSITQIGLHAYKGSYILVVIWVGMLIMWIALLFFMRSLDKRIKETKKEMDRIMQEMDDIVKKQKRRELWRNNR